jgi:hypothetical protein
MGADTEGVLESWLGLSAEAVSELVAENVVATSGGPDISRIA